MSVTVDRLFKAVADETRLRILHLLDKRKELCVCDLIAILGMGQSKVSRHLAYLKSSGLITDRKDGLWSHYALAKPDNAAHRRILDCVGRCFVEMSVLKEDGARLKKMKPARSCRL